MKPGRFNLFCIASLLLVAINFSCAPKFHKPDKTDLCKKAEKHIVEDIDSRRKRIKFRKDLPLRSVLTPLSLAGGLFANWFGQVFVQLPILFPTGREFDGLKFDKMITYSRLKGSRLDEIHMQSIAETNYEMAECFYDVKKFDDSISYLLLIHHDIYIKFVGRDDFYYMLGMSYYNVERYELAYDELNDFMIYSEKGDKRRKEVEQVIKRLEYLREENYW